MKRIEEIMFQYYLEKNKNKKRDSVNKRNERKNMDSYIKGSSSRKL